MIKVKRLLIDVGVGYPDTEAWQKQYREFTIVGLEPGINRYNALKSVYPGRLLNLAVAEEDGELDCWEDETHAVMLRFSPDFQVYCNPKRVKKKAIKLDSLNWKEFDEIHIWADIEGSELIMLKGAKEMLSSGKVRWINLEIRKIAPVNGWPVAQQVYLFLSSYGFIPTIPLKQLQNKGHRDVIFIPRGE